MTITFIGHGYVGLVTAAVFADLGNTVYCVGRNPEKINNLKKGLTPFFEPGLEELVKKNLEQKRLIFTLDYQEAIPEADVVFICVGTPSLPSGEADLSAVFKASEEIAKNLKGYTVVACKSTVPVGTNRRVAKILEKGKKKDVKFDIASCPEFLKEGTALHDTQNPDRIVAGADSVKALDVLEELHKPINSIFLRTTIETAEMIKYGANTLLAAKISFANSMSFLCDIVGADIEQVMEGIGLDNRIGKQFLAAGVGYGGSCFPKDVKALVAMTKRYKTPGMLFEAVEEVNQIAHEHFFQKVKKYFHNDLKGKKITLWGLAFKPDTDDMRDAPSLPIIKSLLNEGAKVVAYDPKAVENAKKSLGEKYAIEYTPDAYSACAGTDALLIVTEWNEFKQADLEKVKKQLKKPVIFDGRNIYEAKKVKELGFEYYGTGK
ncbi:UDP-glucose/GDP-mannose dehydrogenase family protein [Candidatus Microgenomates bacterium]|nr:UDP-glucose/GDP-mannose dehydrogenase family protein [Candidatus Microgenomates bacterium]